MKPHQNFSTAYLSSSEGILRGSVMKLQQGMSNSSQLGSN